jgi:hypothetical protein
MVTVLVVMLEGGGLVRDSDEGGEGEEKDL